MRYLIVGKDGMLGHDLIHAFGNEDLFAYDASELDITNRDSVMEKFFSVQPDVVINAAGYTNVDMAEIEEEKAKKVNGYAVGVLANACREIDATLVHISTDYVFNGTKRAGYGEDDAVDPINSYGRSKALGEKLLLDEMELLSDDSPREGKYFLIRTSWLYGHHGKNFVETMLDKAKKRQKMEVVNDQFGKPTSSADLARQIKWLLASNEYPSGIYHITNEGITNWYEFARTIFKLAKIKIDVLPCSSDNGEGKAKRPAHSALINNKLPPLRPWKEALADYIGQRSKFKVRSAKYRA